VAIALIEDNSDRLTEMLGDGRLDLALIGSAGTEESPGISTAVLIDEELAAAVAPGHPLASNDTVTVNALRDVPLVSLPKGTGVRAALDAACAAAGFEPRVVFEASSSRRERCGYRLDQRAEQLTGGIVTRVHLGDDQPAELLPGRELR
jgi:DNA-binding transcriptional LysR family regulator